jgi:hypothetical protein
MNFGKTVVFIFRTPLIFYFLSPLSFSSLHTHPHTQLEEYIALCRKDMYIDISVSEVAQLHSLLIKYQKDMVSSPDLG